MSDEQVVDDNRPVLPDWWTWLGAALASTSMGVGPVPLHYGAADLVGQSMMDVILQGTGAPHHDGKSEPV